MPSKKKNSWLFQNLYWDHAWMSINGTRHAIAEGRSEIAAHSNIDHHQKLRQRCFDLMGDKEALALLRITKVQRYGTIDGPTWEWFASPINFPQDPNTPLPIAILEHLLKTHGPPVDERNRWYKAVSKPTPQFKELITAQLHWQATENPHRPWQCTLPEMKIEVRIGAFPIDHLYQIYSTNDEKLGVIDDWPTTWTRDPFTPTTP